MDAGGGLMHLIIKMLNSCVSSSACQSFIVLHNSYVVPYTLKICFDCTCVSFLLYVSHSPRMLLRYNRIFKSC